MRYLLIILGLLAAIILPHKPAIARPIVTMQIEANYVLRDVPSGVIGWGAMWKRATLWPVPPQNINNNAEHAAYIERLGAANQELMLRADVRNISWPWGVEFSTWAVNWENSFAPWEERQADCVQLLGRVSAWCETSIVGVGDLMTLADRWGLEAITVAVPLAVIDGRHVRWGPGFFDHAFPDDVIDKIANHAADLVTAMQAHPSWDSLDRVYLSAGCEWRHYGLRNPSAAVLTYARLVQTIRENIDDPKVIIVASASDGADLFGATLLQTNSWNHYLYEALHDVEGVVLDLHRYRGMVGIDEVNGLSPMTNANIDRLLQTGVSQRDYLAVAPQQWGASGAAMPSVLLENAIHGRMGDHATHSDERRPWPVAMAHADLVREALASEVLTFLGWAWFPENIPREWPHGAVYVRDNGRGELSRHAAAQAFLSRFHRGHVLAVEMSDDSAIRGNAVRGLDNRIRAYGGNFSREAQQMQVVIRGAQIRRVEVEFYGLRGYSRAEWNMRQALEIPAMTLWRLAFN